MHYYEQTALKELQIWQNKMQQRPGLVNRLTKKVQDKVNSIIPEKVHKAITTAIKQMVRAVLFGSGITTTKPLLETTLQVREARISERIEFYKKTAAAEGGITGAGGFMLALADFPILLALKMKMLFDIAALYGFNTDDYKERLYLLYIFQLTFSSQSKRRDVYLHIAGWEDKKQHLPEDINQFEWRSFQQEYRDYIDLAKMAQLIPVIGAAVGFVVNYRLLKKLGETAMNAYRMRLLQPQLLQ